MPEPSDIRLDLLIVQRNLSSSRTEAQRAITAGAVCVDGKIVDRPNRRFSDSAVVEIKDEFRIKYVSRGGEKLEAALKTFGISPAGACCLDIGISTGGFADCLLQAGAKHVTGVDVGHRQLHLKLQANPRIELREGVNARTLTPSLFPNVFSIVTMDVSFISATLLIPVIPALMQTHGFFICLIKPQFEVGAGNLGKNGIVTDLARRVAAVVTVHYAANSVGLQLIGSIESPIVGGDGNVEYLSAFTTT